MNAGGMTMLGTVGRWAELLAFFVGVPAAMYLFLPPYLILPVLYVAFALVLVLLLRDGKFERSQLWNAASFRVDFRRVVLVFLPCGTAVAAVVAIAAPDLLLSFPRERPAIWALVMLLYPVLSVYPQEVIYRAFFFHRYSTLVSPRAMIAMSGLLFGYMHVIFQHWVPVALTCIGGVLFAYTYARTRSTLASSVEHALHGGFVFTIGLGQLFYAGNLPR